MKGACFPFSLEHYHGMIGKDQTANFRETPSGKIILARFDPMKDPFRSAGADAAEA